MSYIIISTVGLFVELSQILTLIIYPLQFLRPNTLRKLKELSVPKSEVYGRRYPDVLLHMSIGLVYGPIAPMIVPLLMIYFTLSFTIHKYNALYVMEQKYEAGGVYMYTTTTALFACALLAQVLLGAYFPIKSDAPWLSISLLPLTLFLCYGYYWIRRYGNDMLLLSVSEAKKIDQRHDVERDSLLQNSIDLVDRPHDSDSYLQPALVRSKWTTLISNGLEDVETGPIDYEPFGVSIPDTVKCDNTKESVDLLRTSSYGSTTKCL